MIFRAEQKFLQTFVTLLIFFLIIQDEPRSGQRSAIRSSRAQVSANVINQVSQQQQQQQQQQNNGSSNLHALSERSSTGLNSRYLSASGTASLAAATVAAAAAASNNGGSAQQQSNNNQEASRNFLLHQQQQQQQNVVANSQQQQQSSAINNNQQAAQNGQSAQPLAGAANTVTNQQQSPQFNTPQVLPTSSSSSAAAGAGTPVMSTTYTFNPITGQFVPSELSTGLVGPVSTISSGSNNYNQFAAQQNNNNNYPSNAQQQQLLLLQGTSNNNNNNNFSPANSYPNFIAQPNAYLQHQQQQQQRLNQQAQPIDPQLVGLTSQQFNPFVAFNPQYQATRQNQGPVGGFGHVNSAAFNRRNGYTGLTSAPSIGRGNQNNIYNNNQQQQQLNEDDIGTYLQQQQLIDNNNLAANNLAAAFGGGANGAAIVDQFLLPSNNYQLVSSIGSNGPIGTQQQQQANSVNNNIEQPSSSSSSSLLVQQQQQQQQQSAGGVGSSSIQGANPLSSSALILPTSFSTAFSGPPPSPSELKNDQCLAADNRHGTCYQASECIRRGGTPMGKCGAHSMPPYGGMGVNYEQSTSYVCCLFDVTCGKFAAERFVYFRNPNYPQTFDQARNCRAKIGKLDKGICQFRLDLLRFDVAKPTNGNCSQDMLVVSGQNENYVIPKICGLNDGQHYYVGVDESGIITLHMMMLGAFYRRSFEILITQIPCRSDYAAPAHCLQYYMGTHGTIKSFNYDDQEPLQLSASSTNQQQQQQIGVTYDLLHQAADGLGIHGPTAPYGLQFNPQQQQQRHQQALLAAALQGGQSSGRFANIYGVTQPGNENQFGGYPNDLDYTMCIRKESGFCSITYQLSRTESGLQQPFAVGHSLFSGASGGGGNGVNVNDSSWHQVSTECRDDYLLIGGVRLCSGFTSPLVSLNSVYEQQQQLQQPSSIQFSQNGTILNSAGINNNNNQLVVQLQNEYNLILAQLAKIQQQQQATGNVSYSAGTGVTNNGGQQQVPGSGPLNNGNNNLEQQQAVLVRQSNIILQQLYQLTNSAGAANQNNNGYSSNNRYYGPNVHSHSTEGAIITDNTPGPFILRFVSNIARNARGFHIDYRQNPCK